MTHTLAYPEHFFELSVPVYSIMIYAWESDGVDWINELEALAQVESWRVWWLTRPSEHPYTTCFRPGSLYSLQSVRRKAKWNHSSSRMPTQTNLLFRSSISLFPSPKYAMVCRFVSTTLNVLLRCLLVDSARPSLTFSRLCFGFVP